MKTIITVENISKSYRKKQVIKNLSTTIYENEIIAIIGPNGAGKTTLIELLLGIRQPDKGRVGIHEMYKKKIGAQLQDTPIFPELTVDENLRIFLAFYGVEQTKEQRFNILKSFNLDEHAHKVTTKLSGGQQKKLAIAIATAHNPKIIVLDEPSAALDPKARNEMMALIKELKQKGKTIIFSSHDMQEVQELADRVLLIKDFQKQFDDSIANLLNDYDVKSLEELYLKFANEEVRK
ncbi:ABC transporter ATP-binding protein [Metasolibacillus meyeri]|uniref:ABC transporter ATP-binding protein n=1 Tax=Metasolibacillus meyeri TaxID=1071052 RepID=UPI000D307D87|nr:ABC transporter ATP-binding protein [Metasolibacillus meyeri]